jgi:hypothetical protein
MINYTAGVLEANFIEPAHDKQDFERTTLLARLEARLVQMQKDYWFVLLSFVILSLFILGEFHVLNTCLFGHLSADSCKSDSQHSFSSFFLIGLGMLIE